jgi:hypothetical protein
MAGNSFDGHFQNLNVVKLLQVHGEEVIPNGIATTLYGLHHQWNLNFGGPTVEGQAAATSTQNILTSATTMLKLSKSLKYISDSSVALTADASTTVFGGTGVLPTDVAIGTNGAPGKTPTVDQRITRLTGNISATVTMSAADDMTGTHAQTLILFTGNTFSSSGVLKLTLNTANEMLAASSEIFVSTDGGLELSRESAPLDDDQILILTDSGDSTILAGSFIYMHNSGDNDDMGVKACIRTTGGTVAVTYGN